MKKIKLFDLKRSITSAPSTLLHPVNRRRIIGIELGAANGRCVVPRDEHVLEEPSVALRIESGEKSRIGAVGKSARHVLCPGHHVQYTELHPFAQPLNPYLIPLLELFLSHFHREAYKNYQHVTPNELLFTATPDLLECLTPILEKCAGRTGYHRMETVAEADCIYALLIDAEDRPNLIIDIGETATRFYRLGPKGMILEKNTAAGVAVARKRLVRDIRDRTGVAIGPRTADALLRKNDGETTAVTGRDIGRNRPAKIKISDSDIESALATVYDEILDYGNGYIISNGITRGYALLIGGGARTRCWPDYLSSNLFLPVNIAANPEQFVAEGLRKKIGLS